MFADSVSVFHAFNAFLSTVAGEFAKRSVEGLLLVFITYMAVSEWVRSREDSLKFLAWAFGVLALQKLLVSFFLSHVVFKGFSLAQVQDLVAVIDQFMEVLALILLMNAFLFPAFTDRKVTWLRRIRFEVFVCVAGFVLAEGWWLWRAWVGLPAYFYHSYPYLFILLVKIAILVYPVYLLFINGKLFGKYAHHTAIAFLIYLVTPAVALVNFVFFQSGHSDLVVLSQPFPLLAILLFTRVMYLRLVDKAWLQERLALEKQRHAETKELSKLKDEFVSVVSHELRTPLTSIKLYLSLLLSGRFGPLNNEQTKSLKTLQGESNRLARLVEDVLTLSRLERKKQRLVLEKVDLHSICDVTAYNGLAEEKGLVLLDNIPKKFSVVVDSEKFRQIFVNLVGNAIKYTDKGRIVLSAGKAKKGWFFSVSDTGPGIPKDKLPKLFDKFYQADSHLTREKGGTGLGLSIVKELVKLHKGSVSVESSLGHGSAFRVEFPKL